VAHDPAPTGQPSLRRTTGLLGVLVALAVIGSSAVAVALPVLSAELGLDNSGAAWILAAFSLTFSISTAVFGRLADIYGLRLPLRIGGFLFAAGSLAGALAPSFAVLISARLVQGAGAGAVPVLVVGIIAARFDESCAAAPSAASPPS
jgi:MFS family permease